LADVLFTGLPPAVLTGTSIFFGSDMLKHFLSLTAFTLTMAFGHAQTKSDLKERNQEEQVFQMVEVMPHFPQGAGGLAQFLSTNLRYPAEARRDSVRGTVFVGFVINSKGNVSDVLVLKGIGHGCDEEVVRVIRLMPQWTPGRQDGRNVAVRFSLPVKFEIQ
jgi:TonB family protein